MTETHIKLDIVAVKQEILECKVVIKFTPASLQTAKTTELLDSDQQMRADQTAADQQAQIVDVERIADIRDAEYHGMLQMGDKNIRELFEKSEKNINAKFTQGDAKSAEMDATFAKIDATLDRMDAKLTELARTLDTVVKFLERFSPPHWGG